MCLRNRAHTYDHLLTLARKFPFEIGDTVYIVKPGFRSPLGEFVITAAYADDKFELKWKSNDSQYDELVEGKYLRRDPYGMSS